MYKDTKNSVSYLTAFLIMICIVGGSYKAGQKDLLSPIAEGYEGEVKEELTIKEETPLKQDVVPLEQPQVKVIYIDPTPTPTQAPKGDREVIEEIERVFNKEPEKAVAIARCESRLDHSRTNSNWCSEEMADRGQCILGSVWATDYGIFQENDYFQDRRSINKYAKRVKDLTWKENISLAKDIQKDFGWGAWACYTSGKYIEFY